MKTRLYLTTILSVTLLSTVHTQTFRLWGTFDGGSGDATNNGINSIASIGYPISQLSSTSEFRLEGGFIPGLRTHSNATSITLSLESEWNLISVPLTVNDHRKSSIYPMATSAAFAYQGSYVTADSLEFGRGYWLKFNVAQNVNITGFPRNEDTIEVSSKWNIIGSISVPIAVSTIGSIPPGMVVSSFFTYKTANGYVLADTIKPGHAYWIKTNQNGKLILSSASHIPAGNKVLIVADGELPPTSPEGSLGKSTIVPLEFALHQNYPNPFNPSTVIRYDLPQYAKVTLKIYNLLGQEVATLVDGVQDAGVKAVKLDASNFSSGVYIYRITSNADGRTFTDTRKMIVLK